MGKTDVGVLDLRRDKGHGFEYTLGGHEHMKTCILVNIEIEIIMRFTCLAGLHVIYSDGGLRPSAHIAKMSRRYGIKVSVLF